MRYFIFCGDILNILILGGDKRQVYLSKELEKDGHSIKHYYRESDFLLDFTGFDIIILPYPASKDKKNLFNPLGGCEISLEEIFLKARGTRVLSGGSFEGDNLTDYSANERLLFKNAELTAEGAVAYAIDNTEFSLSSARCLVIGNGRIGKLLANKLKLLGARVDISARKEADFAYINAFGYTCIKTEEIERQIEKYDIIFNTVPFKVLSFAALEKTKRDAVIIELASPPYGLSFEDAKTLGIKCVLAAALPGKTAPKTAALILKETLQQYF